MAGDRRHDRGIAFRLFAAAFLAILGAEAAVAVALEWFGDTLGAPARVVLDVVVLAAVALPVLYVLLYRPIVSCHDDLELKDRDLRWSKGYLSSIINTAPECVKLLDAEGRLLEMNPAGLRMLEAGDLSQVVGQQVYGLVAPDNREAFKDLTRRVCGGEAGTLIFRMTGLKGAERWLETHAVPFLDEPSGRTLMLGVTRDVTESRQAEVALRESEEKYRSLFTNEIDAICIFDIETRRLLDVNDAYLKLYGYTREEALRLTTDDISAEVEETREAIRKAAQSGDTLVPTRRHRKKDGTVITVEISAGPFTWKGQRLMYAVARDVTDRMHSEQELRRWASLFRHTSAGVAVGSADGERFELVNPALARMHGYTVEEMLELPFVEMFAPEFRNRLPELMAEVLERGELTYESLHQRKDGSVFPVLSRVALVKDEAGHALYRVGNVLDITERKVAEEALRASEEKYRRIFEHSPLGILHFGGDGQVTDCNPVFAEIIGAPKERVVDFNMLRELEDPRMREAVEAALRGEMGHFEGEYRSVVGGKRTLLEADLAPVYASNGSVVGGVGIFQDVTERVRAEEQVRTSLREKEVLLREVHHRVKNNMQVISSLLTLQARQVRGEADTRLFQEARDRIRSMALVHEQIYGSRDFSDVDMRDYVERLVESLTASFGIKRGAVDFDVAVVGVSMGIDTAIPCGLLLNELISNSLEHAFPDGRRGRVRVALRGMGDGEYELEVADNGVGLPEGIALGETGSMGLQLVSGLVEQLAGTMETRREGGTSFLIRFRKQTSFHAS